MGQGANTSDVYLDPALVCNDGSPSTRTASCQAPCRFVMPQCAIPTTTITATYTVSVEVYDGLSKTETSTFTTAVTVTTDTVSFDPVYVGGGRSGGDMFTPVPVVPMPSVVVPITHNGQPTSRTVVLPNWPTTGEWPRTSPTGGQDPWQPPANPSSTTSSRSSSSDDDDDGQTSTAPWTPEVSFPPRPASTPFTNTRTYPTRSFSTSTTTTTAAAAVLLWPSSSAQFTDQDDNNDDEISCDAWFFMVSWLVPIAISAIFLPAKHCNSNGTHHWL